MRSSRLRRVVVWTLTGGLVVLTLASVAARWSSWFWMLELPGHFRAQLSVALSGLTLGLAVLRAWPHAVIGVVATAYVATPVLALWVPPPRPAGTPAVRILSLNVSFYDRNHDDVVTLIRSWRPDVVGLVEVNERWMEELAVFADVYPHQLVSVTRRGGVALLSRRPLEAGSIRPLASLRRNAAVATVVVDGRALTVAVLHTASPVWAARVTLRDAQLDLLAEWAKRAPPGEMIAVGDFNISPWAPPLHRLLETTGWRNAAGGFGYQPTWPRFNDWMGIPIDHHLVSDGLEVHRFAVLDDTGSDHRAVYSELGFRSPAAPGPPSPGQP